MHNRLWSARRASVRIVIRPSRFTRANCMVVEAAGSNDGVMIAAQGLTKRFGDLTAVDHIELEIRRGEIFGLLGPNGAGKTTTISMLTTSRPITEGRATVNGYDVARQPAKVRAACGIVFQEPSIDTALTARENLELHARLYGVPKAIRRERIEELLALVDLKDREDSVVKTFSGGMKRRLEIARGLLHHPPVIFLDEPTLGLDPQTRQHIWDYIERLRREMRPTLEDGFMRLTGRASRQAEEGGGEGWFGQVMQYTATSNR